MKTLAPTRYTLALTLAGVLLLASAPLVLAQNEDTASTAEDSTRAPQPYEATLIEPPELRPEVEQQGVPEPAPRPETNRITEEGQPREPQPYEVTLIEPPELRPEVEQQGVPEPAPRPETNRITEEGQPRESQPYEVTLIEPPEPKPEVQQQQPSPEEKQ